MKKCPSDKVLAALVLQKIGRRERRQLEAHLRDCPRCREKLRCFTTVATALSHSSVNSDGGLVVSFPQASRESDERLNETTLQAFKDQQARQHKLKAWIDEIVMRISRGLQEPTPDVHLFGYAASSPEDDEAEDSREASNLIEPFSTQLTTLLSIILDENVPLSRRFRLLRRLNALASKEHQDPPSTGKSSRRRRQAKRKRPGH